MSAEEKSQHWWQTVPAILGGLATLVGAITGLLIALDQLDNSNGEPSPPEDASNVVEDKKKETAAEETKTPAEEIETAAKETKTASQGQETAADGFRVIEVSLRADPFDYTGQCPVKIVFSSRISAVGGSGTVSYKFLRSDGASAPVKSIQFDGPGSKTVTNTWTLGAATPRFQPYTGWQSIKIFDPKETESKKASFKIYCKNPPIDKTKINKTLLKKIQSDKTPVLHPK